VLIISDMTPDDDRTNPLPPDADGVPATAWRRDLRADGAKLRRRAEALEGAADLIEAVEGATNLDDVAHRLGAVERVDVRAMPSGLLAVAVPSDRPITTVAGTFDGDNAR
jgi:hypothetical protein